MLITLKFSAVLLIGILFLGAIPSSLNLASADDIAKTAPPVPQRPHLPQLPTFSLPTQSVRSPVVHASSSFTAAQNGDWNVGTTWVGGIVPGDSDDKTIPLGINVTVTTPTNNTGTITNSGHLTISNSITHSYGINNTGTITNSGTLEIRNTPANSTGIKNSAATILNSGKIIVSNSGNNSIGINSTGTITNSGNLTISNSNLGTGSANGSVGIISNGGTITNNSGGLVTVSNSGDSSLGIDNLNTFNNNSGGQVKVSNNGTGLSTGIYNNGGTMTNNSGGLVIISNSNLQSQGIFDGLFNSGIVNILNTGTNSWGIVISDTLTNLSGGLITISNSGSSNSVGIYNVNLGSLGNNGTITVSNAVNTIGIHNSAGADLINSGKMDDSGYIDNIGTITNLGTITIKNSGTDSIGLNNNGTISNPGIISINSSGSNSIGIENSSGKTISNPGTISIKNSGSNSYGIENNNLGTINNSGTISMEDPDAINFVGIHNTGVVNNTGTIYNCFGRIFPADPTNPVVACPTISINNLSMTEGNSGTKNFTFTVTRSGVTTGTSYVNYTTSDGTATISNSDYIPKSGNLTFSGGQTIKTITIPVIGDSIVEQNETFNVNLLNCVGCSIALSPGIGTIQNDDLGCSPPGSGDWTISSSCILASSSSAPRNVIVLPGAVLTIPTGLLLNIDFTQFHLLVNSGGTVLIKAGGAIR